jgi:guanylate kinase
MQKSSFFLILLFAVSCKCPCINKTLATEEGKKRDNAIIVVTGLSGAGKTIVAQKMIAEMKLLKTISYTTRSPRPGEQNGVDYFFITKEKFQKMIELGEFVEYSEHFNNFYGTSKNQISEAAGDVILVINELGAKRISEMKKLDCLIFYLDISEKEMMRRILGRDGTIDRSELKKRIEERNSARLFDGNEKNFYKINTDKLSPLEVFERIKNIYFDYKASAKSSR